MPFMGDMPPPPMYLQVLDSLSTAHCLLAAVLAAAIATVVYRRRETALTSKNGVPLPPGPPARWFWDIAMPTINIAHSLSDLVAEYGPVVALRRGSHVTIVVGRFDAGVEIMEKEGSALADRPRSIAGGEILAQNLRLLTQHSGDRFRRYRRAAHAHLRPEATVAYRDLQMEDARRVITDVLNDPKNHQSHLKRYAASVMLRIQYGKSTPTASDDPEVIRIYESNANFRAAAHPGVYMVERIPWLKYIPGYARELKKQYEFDMQLFRDQMDRVESQMETNQAGDSFMRALLENVSMYRLTRDEMAYLTGELFGAGSGTTVSGISRVIMVAAKYPEAQKRVKDELEEIVGKDRMPTWEDSGLLPQLQALISETLRWRPVTPYGVAHRATRDIVWRGLWIPAGATVLGCNLAICRDPVVFPDPDKFDPQRWIDERGRFRNDMTAFMYGFGRRVCPGRHLADKSLYIVCALLLWSFRIEEKTEAPLDTVNLFIDSVVAHMRPFEVNFIPRSDENRLREMMSEAV